ncbi:tRNA (adenine(22)-N(1))-methyltransferase [Rummeliibacillus suwonensis]|jgi:tRNA (adenine22-N1)-methyltransferase|uniref:tRNA (adenine(22)-N(1))-methyltransferase n=1 Tax=Rummeliibacillus suwonensis TaxID=1306154 RepID=UPI0011B56D37|nr:tRNA (adenine(22)-N(1))-methyltransferase TrmK [Rummeliibacillus suwonensis]MBO2534955.1 tRNA (adenine-N(1))-methyltransferase [Rummeliibacillus suwonensis]
MNAQKLSKRLEKVASFVPENTIVADIGSDHAYLPCYLVLNHIATKVIAGEVVKGPYESACHEVKQEGLQNQITVRLADGLQAIEQEDHITVITIAGMGGPLIASILEKDVKRLTGVKRLILQPNIHAIAIREWAVQRNWKIIDESILKEDGKIYEILVLEPGGQLLSAEALLLGPVLMQQQNDVFKEKWNHEIEQWQTVLKALEKAGRSEEIIEKQKSLEQRIKMVKEILQ